MLTAPAINRFGIPFPAWSGWAVTGGPEPGRGSEEPSLGPADKPCAATAAGADRVEGLPREEEWLCGGPARAPHSAQNLASAANRAPQFAQKRLTPESSSEELRRTPHSVQKASPSVSVTPQWLQTIGINSFQLPSPRRR